jgi:hypothetical protein
VHIASAQCPHFDDGLGRIRAIVGEICAELDGYLLTEAHAVAVLLAVLLHAHRSTDPAAGPADPDRPSGPLGPAERCRSTGPARGAGPGGRWSRGRSWDDPLSEPRISPQSNPPIPARRRCPVNSHVQPELRHPPAETLWCEPDMSAAVEIRDFTALHRLLQQQGSSMAAGTCGRRLVNSHRYRGPAPAGGPKMTEMRSARTIEVQCARRLVMGPAAWARRKLDVQRAVEGLLCGRCSAVVARCACPGWRIAGWVQPGMGPVPAGSGLPSSPRPARVPPLSVSDAERLAGMNVTGGAE